jgi:hypothetical protein
VTYQPQAGPVVTKKPPDPIEEQPPDQKPDGRDVRWIPGYWAWDDQSNDFLWVSGFWRDVPPGHHWMPGTWQQVAGGWQWSPGFWATDESQEINYVPTPPPTIDAGPSTPAPQPTDIYAPGCWMWRDRWMWRPGYWVAYRPDWVWVPANYVWTPAGCIFTEGHWDHPLETRGLLFCPVRLLRRELAGWVFTPSLVVNADFLLSALFVGPARHCYFFGDFFEDRFRTAGFVAWIDYRPTRHSIDPCFAFYRQEFRSDPAWDRNLHNLYRARFAGEVPRPPHTFAEQQKVIQTLTVNRTANVNVFKNINLTTVQTVSALTPLTKVGEERVTRLAALAPQAKVEPRLLKVQRISPQQIAEEKQQIQHVRQVAQQRVEHEGKLVTAGTTHVQPPQDVNKTKLIVPKSPVERPAPATKPPPAPPPPKHEERALPPHQPPKPPQPPPSKPPPGARQEEKPPPKPPPPPKKEDKPPPKPPPPPPKKEDKPPPKPPPPPKKEDKPASKPSPKKEDKPPQAAPHK